QKNTAEENKKWVDHDRIRKRGHVSRCGAQENVERSAAQRHAEHRGQSVPGFLLFGQQEIGEQRGQAEENQHRFGKQKSSVTARGQKYGLPVHYWAFGAA